MATGKEPDKPQQGRKEQEGLDKLKAGAKAAAETAGMMKDYVSEVISDKNKRNQIIESPMVSQAMHTAAVIAGRRNKMVRLLHKGYRVLRKRRSNSEIWQKVKDNAMVLLRMLKAYVTGTYQEIPWPTLVKIVAGIVYLVWFIDLIPDFIPIIGWFDDAVVLTWILTVIKDQLDDFEAWEAQQGGPVPMEEEDLPRE